MTSSFLNLDDDQDDISPVIGAGIKSKPKKIRGKTDIVAVAQAGAENGFTRRTEPSATTENLGPRLGRPPLKEDMIYWRIYLPSSLRKELNDLRDEEGRRLSDVIDDMLTAYLATKGVER